MRRDVVVSIICDMQAIILSIGDELVLGQTVDTNSAWLSAKLAARGIGTKRHETIHDNQSAITAAIRRAAGDARLLIISGGIGPTDDDLTRQALADAMGVELACDQPSLDIIRTMMEKRGRVMAPRNVMQAMCPCGATVIPNANGTAPGICATLDGATIFVTPGVPREMFAMYETSIEPELDALDPDHDVILTAKVNSMGMGESTVAERLGELMDRNRNPKVGTTVAGGMCSVRVRSEGPDRAAAAVALEDTLQQVEARLGAVAFGRDDQTLQEALFNDLVAYELGSIATAESCTGGMIGELLTDMPGSSAYYAGGWITYSNEMKTAQLGVREETIAAHGAVSGEVAGEMAAGALQRAGAGVAISVTGIAGPDGGSPEKPVGTVWLAVAVKRDSGIDVQPRLLLLGGDRQTIRHRAALCALQMARLIIRDATLDDIHWFVNTSAVK